MRPRHRIWCVKHQREDVIFLAGLGYRKHAVARWQFLAKRGEKNQPLLIWAHLKKWRIKAEFTRIVEYGSYECRADAEAELLNLRMSNRRILVEDWLK